MWLRPQRHLSGFEYLIMYISKLFLLKIKDQPSSQSGSQKFVTKICMWFKVYDQYSKIYSANWQNFYFNLVFNKRIPISEMLAFWIEIFFSKVDWQVEKKSANLLNNASNNGVSSVTKKWKPHKKSQGTTKWSDQTNSINNQNFFIIFFFIEASLKRNWTFIELLKSASAHSLFLCQF